MFFKNRKTKYILINLLVLIFFVFFLLCIFLAFRRQNVSVHTRRDEATEYTGNVAIPADRNKGNNSYVNATEERITLILTACEEEMTVREATIAMKSAIIFRKSFKLHFIVFTAGDPSIIDILLAEIKKLKSLSPNAFTYEIRKVTHTKRDKEAVWKCAMERLYFPDTLPEVDKALYIDADALFLKDLTDIWNQFELMNSSQFCGVARDTVNPYWSAYRILRKGKIPYYADGLNSGVLLMDLKKMREAGWTRFVEKIFNDFDGVGICDQDVINIIFHYNPDKILLLPCRFNANDLFFFSIDFVCTDAIRHGLNIMHGTGRKFLSPLNNVPFLHKFYEHFVKYKLGTNVYENLSKPLINELANLPRSVGSTILHFYLEATGILSPIKMNYTA